MKSSKAGLPYSVVVSVLNQRNEILGLEDLCAFVSCAFRDRQVLGEKGRDFFKAAHLEKGVDGGSDICQGLFRLFHRLAGFRIGLSVSLVENVLQVAFGDGGNLSAAYSWADKRIHMVGFLAVVAGAGGGLDPLQILIQQDGDTGICIDHVIVQPGVGLGVSLPLAGASRLGGIEAAALAVLLDVDLPAGLLFHPDGGAGSFGHFNSFRF